MLGGESLALRRNRNCQVQLINFHLVGPGLYVNTGLRFTINR